MAEPEAGDCSHPIHRLDLDAGKSGSRGMAISYRVICAACKEVWPGPVGLVRLMSGLVKEGEDLWVAVRGLGGEKPVPAASPASRGGKVDPGDCEHFLVWLKLESAVGARGRTHSYKVRCVGCKGSWLNAAGLGVLFGKLKENQESLWREIVRLGGARP